MLQLVRVKNPALSLQWFSLLLWFGFDCWPGIFHMQQVWPEKIFLHASLILGTDWTPVQRWNPHPHRSQLGSLTAEPLRELSFLTVCRPLTVLWVVCTSHHVREHPPPERNTDRSWTCLLACYVFCLAELDSACPWCILPVPSVGEGAFGMFFLVLCSTSL